MLKYHTNKTYKPVAKAQRLGHGQWLYRGYLMGNVGGAWGPLWTYRLNGTVRDEDRRPEANSMKHAQAVIDYAVDNGVDLDTADRAVNWAA